MRSCFGPRVSSFDAEEGQAHCALLKATCSFYKQRSPDARLGSLADIRERIRDVGPCLRYRFGVRWVTPLGLLTDSTWKRCSIPSNPVHSGSPRPSRMGTTAMCM